MGADEEERYIRTLIDTVRDLSIQLGQVREQVKDDMARLLAGYREDTHRTLLGIHARILSYEDELVRDRTVRETRQAEIDRQLNTIRRAAIGLIALGLLTLAYLIGQWL